MKINWIIIFVSVLLIMSCSHKNFYQPQDLRELTEKELIESVKGIKVYNQKNAIYKNKFGEIITLDSLKTMKSGCFNNLYFAKYVNEDDDIVEVVIRPATQLELETEAKILLAFDKKPKIEIKNVNCSEIGQILDTIYQLDQEIRQKGNSIDTTIEHQILNTAISIIENCGMPTLNNVTEHQMMGLWLVFQHTHHDIRKKYFPLFLKCAEKGDLEMSQIAIMEDRILMMEGKPQKYGSQIRAGCKTDWELYNLANPETVDKRRAEVGLASLKEYAKKWDIEFNIEQKK